MPSGRGASGWWCLAQCASLDQPGQPCTPRSQRRALASRFNVIAGIGEFAPAFEAAGGADPRLVTAGDIDELWPKLRERLAPDAVILLKASRGVRLERSGPTAHRMGNDLVLYLLVPLTRLVKVFNLFNYITFRAAGAFVTSLLVAFCVGPAILRRLRDMAVHQVVREGTPDTQPREGQYADNGRAHHPRGDDHPDAAMGAAQQPLRASWPWQSWCGWAAIGFLDDYLKLLQKRRGEKNRGLVETLQARRAGHRSASPLGSTCGTTRSQRCPGRPRHCRSSSTCWWSLRQRGWPGSTCRS